MLDEIRERFEYLIKNGKGILSLWPQSESGLSYWCRDEQTPDFQSWVQSSANLLALVVPADRPMAKNLKDILNDQRYVDGSSVPLHTVQKIHGLLESAYDELKLGFFKNFEYVVVAETLDDFLEHAVKFHGSGKVTESSVLASIVLEDTVKKICKKNEIPTKASLEPLVDKLVSENIFTPVKGKRIKSYNGVRNSALHANWDEIDIQEVGHLIKGVQGLIEDYL